MTRDRVMGPDATARAPDAQELRRLAFAKQQEAIVLAEQARQALGDYHDLRRAAEAAEWEERLSHLVRSAS